MVLRLTCLKVSPRIVICTVPSASFLTINPVLCRLAHLKQREKLSDFSLFPHSTVIYFMYGAPCLITGVPAEE